MTAIEEDAAAIVKRIVREAEEAAEEMIQNAVEEASVAREKRLSAVRREIEMEKAAAISGARIRKRAMELMARKEAIDDVLKEASGRLLALSPEERASLVNRFYGETKVVWGGLKDTGSPVVLVNPADVGAVKDEGVEVRPDPGVALGVVLVSVDGRYRFENTVASRMRRNEESLRAAANDALFG